MSGQNEVPRRAVLAVVAMAPVALAVGAARAQTTGQAPASRGKVALVTGSSRGIGAATARRLARDGYAVTVNCEKNRDLAAGVVREIEATGGRAIWVQADVSDPSAVQRLFEENERAFGGVDVVVSNAGIMRLAPFRDMTDADFSRMVDVNQKGSFYVLREAARRVRDGGRIIALSSSITQLRSPTYGAYAATKAAQELYANILAKELEGRMISVNAMAPGLVNTTLFTDGKTPEQIVGFAARTPHKRLGEPSDIADAIAALCSGDGAWINGQTVFANGGVV
ncbi:MULTISPECIES: SDR family oxidoreductase [unclassified Mesorhizobium]|uniref:SDR family oxidoreductase n=1 Tax=unclassified Mesorhizobium TaxID=325217 RepID=UPI000F764F04|nr:MULTISPECIES: SDR family oxidoreductase [unclassified Mesorhizobium]RUU46927.1 SDR family oxidoreductase [Mesorhizobium sp. M6A.T.Ca.TU.002.02.2.1]AZO68384.1 SDR family oxidoreductase [Mesorhizobium sp. M6A.T.Cr.TU.016.01.1.1]RWP48676.1 MAG: SDR family oxidoreductase [Mesorhizobium sp.]RWP54750.1 MAG: SDR family oxidoreductase [Mesorhizobium sp.]RWQ68825.1 MAG: SDR family oxidoreductase [Mesorhizobium sp.]